MANPPFFSAISGLNDKTEDDDLYGYVTLSSRVPVHKRLAMQVTRRAFNAFFAEIQIWWSRWGSYRGQCAIRWWSSQGIEQSFGGSNAPSITRHLGRTTNIGMTHMLCEKSVLKKVRPVSI